MNAIKAKKISNKARVKGINYQIAYVLMIIKKQAKLGQTTIIVDFSPHVQLFDKDWEWFEKQGYEVERPKTIIVSNDGESYHKFGRISW